MASYSVKVTAKCGEQIVEISAFDLQFNDVRGTNTSLCRYAAEAVKNLYDQTPQAQRGTVIAPVRSEEDLPPNVEAYSMEGHPITQKQVNLLRHLGYNDPLEGYTIAMADNLIQKLKRKQG